MIPVEIGGHRFWCNPDSGYSALVSLDLSKALAAGLPVGPGIPTPDGNPPSPGDRNAFVDVVVGGVTFPKYAVIVRRFPLEAPEMDCIMGVAMLRRFVVEFDYITPRITLFDRDSYQPPSGAERIPLLFRPNPNVPYVDIEVTLPDGSRQPARVIPDTGTAFYGSLLVGNAADRLKAGVERTAQAIVYPDPNVPDRVTSLEAARPVAVTIGSQTVRAPVVAILRGRLAANSSFADGTLGEGVLRRFTVAFDFDGRAMYLKANARIDQPHPFDAIGVGFRRQNGRDVVFVVLPESPGAAAGIRVGDVLVAVDGQPAAAMTPIQRRDLLSTDGATRMLQIEREGIPVSVRITLRGRI